MNLYSTLVRRVVYPLDCYRTGESAALHYAREFEKSQYLSTEELQGLAFQRLQRIVERACQHNHYYRRTYEAAGVVPSDIRTEDDLLAIPVLDKRQLQAHRDELLDPNWPREKVHLNRTGGSTGTPVEYYVSSDRKCSRAAATWRHNRFVGWDIGDKSAFLWGAVRDATVPTFKARLRNLLIDRHFLFNTAGFQEEDIVAFNEQLKRFRPKVILAYANSLALFAEYYRDRAITPYQPEVIVTSAEVLTDESRSLIEDVFAAPVYNRYGCREFSVVASECRERDGLHVMAEGLYVEVVKDGRHAEPGEVGELIVTDMLNEPMPLIRYRIGDCASWKAGDCACGRGLPRLERIAGRVTDFIVGSDGRLCSGAVLTVAIVAKRPSLGQVQIQQDERGKVLYRIGTGNGSPISDEDRRFLLAQTAEYLGDDTMVEFEFVDVIPHEPSGKFLFSRSSVTNLLS